MDILTIAYLLFVLNFLFGVLVALGIIPRGRWGKVHHFLYLLTIIGIVAAIIEAVVLKAPLLPAIGVMALLLLAMTRFHGGSRAHSLYATLCLALYSALLAGRVVSG